MLVLVLGPGACALPPPARPSQQSGLPPLRTPLAPSHPRALRSTAAGRSAGWTPIIIAGASDIVRQARARASAQVTAASAVLRGAATHGTCGACSDARVKPSLTSRPQPAPQCPLGCSGHGTCRGVCQCLDRWGGPACGLATQPGTSATSAASQLTVVVAVGDGSACKAALKAAVAALPVGMAGVPVVAARPAAARTEAAWQKPSQKDRKKPPKPQTGDTVGRVLNAALKRVSTPYAVVLTGRDTLAPGVTAAAVVAAMRASGLVVAGGFTERVEERGRGGVRLLPACHAVRARNYTLDATPGWATGWGGCTVCDYTSASFVVDVARFPGFDTDVLEPQLAGMALSLQTKRGTGAAASIGACPGAIQFRQVPACHASELSSNRLEKATRALTRTHPISHWNLPDGTLYAVTTARPARPPAVRRRVEATVSDGVLLDAALALTPPPPPSSPFVVLSRCSPAACTTVASAPRRGRRTR